MAAREGSNIQISRRRFTLSHTLPRHLWIIVTALYVLTFLGKLLSQPLSLSSSPFPCQDVQINFHVFDRVFSPLFSSLGYLVSTTDSSGSSSGCPGPLELPMACQGKGLCSKKSPAPKTSPYLILLFSSSSSSSSANFLLKRYPL